MLTSIPECKRAFGYLGQETLFLDLETTGKDAIIDKIISIALIADDMYVKKSPCFIIDCRQMDMVELGKILGPIFDRSLLVGQNLKFDLSFLSWHCHIKPTDIMDFMLSEQILQGRGFGSGIGFSLADIARRRGVKISKEGRDWFIDLDKRPDEWNAPFPENQLQYIENDVRVLERLYYYLVDDLEKNGLLEYCQFECQVTPCLVQVELDGIKVDKEQLRLIITEEEKKYEELESRCISEFGPYIMGSREKEIQQYREEMESYTRQKEGFLCQVREEWDGEIIKQQSLENGEPKIQSQRDLLYQK